MKRSFLSFQKFEENKLTKTEQKSIRGGGDPTALNDDALKTQTTENTQNADEGGVVPIKGVGSI